MESDYVVRLKMQDGSKYWTEEQTIYAKSAEDAVAIAAANAHPAYSVRGAEVKKGK